MSQGAANLSFPSSEGEVAERCEVDGGAVPFKPEQPPGGACPALLHPHLASPSEEGEG